MTESNDEETPEEEFSEKEKRYIKLHAEASYQASKRIQREEAQQRIEEPAGPIEPEITLYNNRFHWAAVFSVFATLWLIPAVMVFLLVVGWYVQEKVQTLDPNLGLVQYLFPGAPLVLSAIAAVIIVKNNWRQILRGIVIWRNSRLIITDRRVLYVVNVKGWVLNLISNVNDVNAVLARETINNADVEQGGIAELLGYATIRLLSQADQDKRFTRLRYLRDPELLRTIFDVDNDTDSVVMS